MLKGEIESIVNVRGVVKDNSTPLKFTPAYCSYPFCSPHSKNSIWAASTPPSMGGFNPQAPAPPEQAFAHGPQEIRREDHDFKRENPRRIRST